MRAVAPFAVIDLIRPLQRLVDALDDVGNGVDRVQALIGIHLAGQVCIGCHLPSAEVNGLQAGAHLLDRLIAGERA
jgi:hypothetical protein